MRALLLFLALFSTNVFAEVGPVIVGKNGPGKTSSKGCGISDYVCSGTYVPAISGNGCSGAPTAEEMTYMRIGNMVTVTGQVTFQNAGCSTNQGFSLSVPISVGNFASNKKGSGSWTCDTGGTTAGFVYPNSAAKTMFARYQGATTCGGQAILHFSYQIP